MTGRQDRYARQRVIPEIGEEGQEKLLGSSVLIIGCGALGSIQSQLLVRAGVGRIRIADADVPEEVNLHRQILFDESDVAHKTPKAVIAERRLRKVNSGVAIEGLALRVGAENIESLLADVDLVMDASDNFETRYVINDACVKHGKPWIYGGVIGTSGMTMPIEPARGPCLRCLFPEPPHPGSLPTGVTDGILNSAPVAIAALQCATALRLLIEGRTGEHRLLLLDLWQASVRSVDVRRDEECICCSKRLFEFLGTGEQHGG